MLSDTLQVCGTPSSGKTILTWLLAYHIYQQDQTVHIITIFGWNLKEVRKIGGWKVYLQCKKGWDEDKKTIFIFDEAQMSYGDSLWHQFFKNIKGYGNHFAIAFASYGSPTSWLHIPNAPSFIRDSQRVTLHRGDGLGTVGLLFTQAEFDDYVDKRFPSKSSKFYFHSSFYNVVFDITGGHVGAFQDFMKAIAHHEVRFLWCLGHITWHLSPISVLLSTQAQPALQVGFVFGTSRARLPDWKACIRQQNHMGLTTCSRPSESCFCSHLFRRPSWRLYWSSIRVHKRRRQDGACPMFPQWLAPCWQAQWHLRRWKNYLYLPIVTPLLVCGLDTSAKRQTS